MSSPILDLLSVELEAALVRELLREWRYINWSYFKDALRAPVILLSDTVSRLGMWSPQGRTLEISRRLVLDEPWGRVVEVLKHEAAHQFVHEKLGVFEEAHGPQFRELCARLGIDATAKGLPAIEREAESASTRVLSRIRKLLALAESPNEHEAQAAMAQAQRLMLKHNLEAAPVGRYTYKHLGKPAGKIWEAERCLAVILQGHFFVEVIWVSVWRPLEGKRGQVLEVCGTPENIAMAEYVHAFLLHTATQRWLEYRRERRIRSNRDRRTFLAGVMIGFQEKLKAQEVRHRQEGLVWAGDSDLRSFYRKRHQHIHSVRSQGSLRTEAHAHGCEAGRQIVLHRPVSGGPDGRSRLLGSGGRPS